MDERVLAAYLRRLEVTRPPIARRGHAAPPAPGPPDRGAVREPEHPPWRAHLAGGRRPDRTRSSAGGAEASATSSTGPSRCCWRPWAFARRTGRPPGCTANGQPGPPFDHLALIVHPADGSGPWLADVGFGSHSVFPLLLDHRDGQHDPAGRFLLADADDGDVDVLQGRRAAVPDRAARADASRLHPHLLVAADLTAIPLHPRHHLLAAHRMTAGSLSVAAP